MNRACEAFEHELSAYLDGELPPAERGRVEAHLAQCPRCAAELRELRRVGETLRRWETHEVRSAPSTGFRNRVLRAVGGDPGSTRDAEVRVWRHAAWAAAVAAGVVAAIAWSAHRADVGTGTDVAAAVAAAEGRARAAESLLESARRSAAEPGGLAPSLAVERVAALPPLVGPLEPVAPDAVVPAGVREDVSWEGRGEGFLHPDAVAEFERQVAEKRRLTMEERVARVESREPGADPTTAAPPASPVSTFLSQVSVSATHFPPYEEMQVWPLELASAQRGTAPWLAERAIEGGVLSVTEDDSGAVVAQNKDLNDRPVLLLAGDVLKGGRRDRVVREDMLLQPGRTLYVPAFGASTVRESTRYRTFTRSRLLAPFDVRAVVATASLGAAVGQADVDAAIGGKDGSLVRLGSVGNQGSLENLYANGELQRVVSAYVDAFRRRLDRPSVVGFASAVRGRLVGVEICGDTETFRALRDRLLASHVLFARSAPGGADRADTPADAAVQALLTSAVRAVYGEPEAAGSGSLSVFRSVQGDVFGAGVVDGARVVHATVFAGLPDTGATGSSGGGGRGPFGRPLTGSGEGGGLPTGPDRSKPGGSGGLDGR